MCFGSFPWESQESPMSLPWGWAVPLGSLGKPPCIQPCHLALLLGSWETPSTLWALETGAYKPTAVLQSSALAVCWALWHSRAHCHWPHPHGWPSGLKLLLELQLCITPFSPVLCLANFRYLRVPDPDPSLSVTWDSVCVPVLYCSG